MSNAASVLAALPVKIVDQPNADPSWVDVLTMIASVFAAIGTVGAVIVALWQVRKATKRSLRVRTVATGDKSLTVYVVNDGAVAVTLRTIQFRPKDGPPRQVQAVQGYHGDELPKLLNQGETAEYRYRLSDLDADAAVLVHDTLGDTYTTWVNPFRNVKRPWRQRLRQRFSRLWGGDDLF